MTNNYTPTLGPDTGTQQCPGATAAFDSTLWYMGNGHNSTVWAVTRTTATDTLEPATHPDESKNWSQLVLDDQPNFKGYRAQCGVPPSLAVAGTSMYFVWIQNDGHDSQPANSVWATQYTPTGHPARGTWSAPAPMTSGSNTNEQLIINQTNFSAMSWGEYLVGCYLDDQYLFHLVVYDTGDWSNSVPSHWTPIASWSKNFAGWPNFPKSPSELGNQISMDWFAIGEHVYYVISFFNDNTNQAYVLHLIDVKPFGEWGNNSFNQPFTHWNIETWSGVYKGVNVIREPAGRMLAYYADSNSNINIRTMATDGADSDGILWATFGSPQLLFNQEVGVDQAPVPAFVWGATSNPSVTIKVMNQEGKEQPETRTATVVQSYQFVMFKNDGIKLVYSHYGQAVRIPNAYQISNTDPNLPSGQQKLFVTGIVDAPLPLPAVNVALQSEYNPQTLASVEYGTTASTGDSRSTNWSWSAGFISSGYANTGAGPAWNISFNAGMSGASGSSSTEQIVNTVIADTNATQTSAIEPNAMMVLSTILFHRDAYTFYDLSLTGDNYTEVTDAVVPTMVWITDTGVQNPAFTPYTVTTGNLWSYTRSGWNARMQQLGYQGADYFDDIILAQDSGGNYVNALVFSAGSSDNPYLEYSWSTGGQVKQAFTSVDQSYTESGWHLDASAYVGYSWGLGASVFGIGEKLIAQFLVGGSYSRSTQEKTTNGNSWGITVSYSLRDPPMAGNRYPGEIFALSWRLYFLKSNSLWLQEALKYGNLNFPQAAQIDPGSAPWRILFEVVEDSIEFKGDNINVVYRDTSGDVIELWYGTEQICGGTSEAQILPSGSWSWINLTNSAIAYQGSSGSQLPSAELHTLLVLLGHERTGIPPLHTGGRIPCPERRYLPALGSAQFPGSSRSAARQHYLVLAQPCRDRRLRSGRRRSGRLSMGG